MSFASSYKEAIGLSFSTVNCSAAPMRIPQPTTPRFSWLREIERFTSKAPVFMDWSQRKTRVSDAWKPPNCFDRSVRGAG